MSVAGAQVTGTVGEVASPLTAALPRQLAKAPTPVVLEECPGSSIFRFPAQIDFDVTSPNNVASRRRGRFVIKLAATLFLATLDDFDSPGRCATAMNSLWGHVSLALEYLRRRQPPGVPCPAYTSQQLTKAESQWKASLGNRVLQPDGFQSCWNELVPFFRRRLAEEASRHVDPVPLKHPAAAHLRPPPPEMLRGASGAPLSSTRSSTVTALAAAATTVADGPAATSVFAANRGSSLRPATSPAVPSLDLSKVPARGFSVLFDATVAFLRTTPAARRVAYASEGMEAALLTSRGWLPVHYVLDGLHAELSNDSALKTLWLWWASGQTAAEVAALYVSLLTQRNVTGELQFLHSSEESTVSTTTHLRAAWGHVDKTLALAVMEEHHRVPLRSLARDGADAVDSGDAGAASEPRNSSWFEWVADVKVLRKALADVGGHVYPADSPYQVLVSRDAIADLCAPLRSPASLKKASSTGAAELNALLRRTKAPVNAPGTEVSAAFGSAASTATCVSGGEFAAMLQPASGVAVSAVVAAMTFALPRFAFVALSETYFTKQAATVCGLEVAAHVMRNDAAALSDAGDSSALVSVVALPHSPRTVLVLPLELSYGRLSTDAVLESATTLAEPAALPLEERLFPSAPSAVDGRAMYQVLSFPNRGGQWIAVRSPPTELLVDLRIASLWDLWLWYGYTLAKTAAPTAARSEKSKAAAKTGVALKHRQLVAETFMGTALKRSVALEAEREGPGELRTTPQAEGGGAAGATTPPAVVPDETTVSSDASPAAEEAADGAADAVPRLPWEFFPATAAEAMVLRLDAAYQAGLRSAWERWHPTGLQMLRPVSRATGDDVSLALSGERTGTRGGDVLLSLLPLPTAEASSAAEGSSALPSWQVQENALWEGLAGWMDAVQTACEMPHFSLLLPPSIELQVSAAQPTERRRLGTVGRKKGLAGLRRLFSGLDAPTGFFVLAERTYTPPLNFDVHRVWVIEEDALSDAGGSTRDEERWAIAGRPEVLLADMRDNHDERVVGMYLRQACVLQRSGAPSRTATAAIGTAAANGGGIPASPGSESGETQRSALRLLRFVGRASSAPEESTTANAAGGGVLEGIPLHAPLRHAHCGCRVSPLACDELVLGAAWPATAIVDYALLPPLREALMVYCAKLRASQELAREGDTAKGRGSCLYAVPSTAALAAMVDDLRRELLLVLTDEAAMELREFYGDGLLDYCVAVTTLSYRHASSNFAIWRGGNITESSTNNALVVRALPSVLRDYWMARRRICNDKRLADCVESLFGAVSMALWVLPIRRRHAAGVGAEQMNGVSEAGGEADTSAPDADMLLYVASALLQLLSGRSEG
uniref:Dicer 2 n=1 Tax=Crithidia fasciculata TaxID=5656 RepID=A0A220XK86_CRIFA|nr:dicer 2 [Crithidia fasciculata]